MNKSDHTVNESYQAIDVNQNKVKTRAIKKIQRLLMEFWLYKESVPPEIRYLENRPDEFELFSFPFSDWNINAQSIVKEADIINFHWVAGFLDYKSFFLHNKKKVVWTLHDINSFSGGCHFPSGCDLYLNSCQQCHQLQNTIDPSYSNKALKIKLNSLTNFNDLTIITPSSWINSLSSNSTLFKRFKHTLIRDAVDTGVFKPYNKKFARDVFSLPEEKPILRFISSDLYNKRKGFNYLIEAIEILGYQDSIIVLCDGLSRGQSIDKPYLWNLGKLNDERLMSLSYCASDYLIVPSLEDNLPNVIIESLLCGTPVIGFNNGGIGEMISHGVNGYLSEKTTSESLANTLKMGLDNLNYFNPEIISKSSGDLYNFNKIGNEYYQLYLSILG